MKTKKDKKLRRLLHIVNEAYPDGMIETYRNLDTGEENLGASGDTLAEFIAREIVETYEPQGSWAENLERASGVMMTAYEEIGAVVARIQQEEAAL